MAKKKGYRVKHTGQTYPKIDAKKLAKALGADSVTGPQKVDRQGREYFEFDVITEDGDKTVRVYQLTQNDLETGNYKLLCEPEGQFFFHCLQVCRNVENFHNRVWGYQILKPTYRGMKMRLAFYEKT